MHKSYNNYKFILAVNVNSKIYLIKNYLFINEEPDKLKLYTLSDLNFSDESILSKEYKFYLFSVKNSKKKSFEYLDDIKKYIDSIYYSHDKLRYIGSFSYKVDPKNKLQYGDKYSMSLNIRNLENNKYFISHPLIIIDKNLLN